MLLSSKKPNDLEAITIEQLLGSLQAYEEKRKKKEEIVKQLLKTRIDSTEEGNVQNDRRQQVRGRGRSRGHGRGRNREPGGGRGHERGRGWDNNFQRRESSTRGHGRGNVGSRYDKSHIKCYNCEKFDHYASECRAPIHNRVEEKVNYVEERSQEDGTSLLAYKDNARGEDNIWYLDTSASNHMCGKRSMFVELDESVSGNVAFGDKSKVA